MIFAAFYVGEANFDGTRAAELTGIVAKNRHTLNSIATSILAKPHVKEYILQQVQDAQITQGAIFTEMAKLAFWDHDRNRPSFLQDRDEDGAIVIDDAAMNPNAMAEAKWFDTMMKGKIKSLADLAKQFDSDTAKEISKVKKAIEQHREEHPTLSAEDRSDLFTKAGVDPKVVQQVMTELLKSDENRQRLAEIEKADAEEAKEEAR